MSNDPCMDSLGYPFDETRDYVCRTPSDPRTGCSFIVCRILTFLESRLGDLVSALGWEICWMEYIWDEKPPCLITGPRRLLPAFLSHFECLLFYCLHLLFIVFSIILEKFTRRELVQSLLTASWRRNDMTAGSIESMGWYGCEPTPATGSTRSGICRAAGRLRSVWKRFCLVRRSGGQVQI